MMAAPAAPHLAETLTPIAGRIQADAPLGPTTWFRVGGPAEVLVRPAGMADLAGFLAALPLHVPLTVIGAASNLIVRDGGIAGVVIRLARGFGDVTIDGDGILAGAAALDANVAEHAAQASLAGLEFLSGIPGAIGGAVAMNAGAYGGDVAQSLDWAEILTRQGELVRLRAADIGFSYRHSGLPAGCVIVRARLHARPGNAAHIAARMAEIRASREATQPVRARPRGRPVSHPPPAPARHSRGSARPRLAGRRRGAPDPAGGQHPRPGLVVETGQGRDHRQPVEERQVAAQNDRALEEEDDPPAHRAHPPVRPHGQERRAQFRQVVEKDAGGQQAAGQEMEPAAERIGHRLGLEEVREDGKVAPAGVAPELDESRSQHDAEDQPQEQPDHHARRRAARKRPRVEQWTKEDGQEAGFQQLDLPAVGIPILPDVHDGHVQGPQGREQQRVAQASGHEAAQRKPGPGHAQQRVVGTVQPEQGGQPQAPCPGGAQALADVIQEPVRRQQPVRPDQRQQLPDGDQEGDGVHRAQPAQQDEARQPERRWALIGGRRLEGLSDHGRKRGKYAPAGKLQPGIARSRRRAGWA